ncbi:3-oxoacyl-acyl carrier protein reductase [Ligilactobacillus equi DSM 15833 = JCM 10991]|uniref:3-oxoacyl-acyl carrier protein reductase n=2 Tax=Ligilactobacillus equi TaxID=137357 RepID=V7HUI4_9LACO|nr:SDR family NAD(P)-dependent oxidoreductase [Ligilactobacillus equi]ETA73577.1 3-oxoacyl-acyl carrier protein reductase [Ligilactobacillus equi DPC 6820]KRL77868.1 3-oxoacyl-acyl carrier protein reductase [Ligilactobacillus equi DSM 15833 = JCM 10991]MCQ2557293.1 SDR family oxidoreductase [Ligilactobacillus sp.]
MKWALICGASGDIGSQVARDLALEGWSLYLHYHQNESKTQVLAQELMASYPKQDFLVLQADLTQLNQVENLAQNLFSLDALIFTQGTTSYGLFAEQDPASLTQMLAMQVTGPLHLVQLLQSKLTQKDQSRVIFIGSVYGKAGSALEVGYSTVKGALSAFAKAYSKEVATLGLTVNVLAPGAVATQMNTKMFSKASRQAVAAEIPLGRFAKVEEVSYWVKALLDEKAAYLTGQTIYMTGGWLE